MSISTKLTEDMKAAMKAKDAATLQTIRLIMAAIQRKSQDIKDEAVKKGVAFEGLTEDQIIQVIQTFKKQSEETIDGFQKRGDVQKIAQLTEEIRVANTYLPAQLSKQEVRAIVDRLAAGLDNKGAVMKAVMGELKGKADNKLISEVVDEFLKG